MLVLSNMSKKRFFCICLFSHPSNAFLINNPSGNLKVSKKNCCLLQILKLYLNNFLIWIKIPTCNNISYGAKIFYVILNYLKHINIIIVPCHVKHTLMTTEIEIEVIDMWRVSNDHENLENLEMSRNLKMGPKR